MSYVHKLNDALIQWKQLEESVADKSAKEMSVQALEGKVHELQQKTLDLFKFLSSLPSDKWNARITSQIEEIGTSSLEIEKILMSQSGYSRGSESRALAMRVADLKKTGVFQELTSVRERSTQMLGDMQHMEELRPHLEEIHYTSKDPAVLEQEGRRCLDLALQHPDVFRFYSNWGVRLLEKASDIYQSEGNVDQACKIRMHLARFPIAQHGPIGQLRHDLDTKSVQIHNPLVRREMVLGVGYKDQDGPFVRRSGINARRIAIDGKTVIELNTKLLREASHKVRERLELLGRPEAQAQLIGSGACASVQVRSQDPYMYYSYENNQFTKEGALTVGTALVVEFPGIGKVEIGNDPAMDSMYNKLRITLEDGATEQDLQNICGLCGLSFLMTQSTVQDQKRAEFHFVLHQLYPKLSTQLELEAGFDFHGCPMEVLTARIQREPNSKKILEEVNSSLKDVENYTIYPGCEGFRLKGLERLVEARGCRGFMMGVRPYASTRDIVKTTAAMLTSGIISSQQRFDQGILGGGVSSIKDIANNSGDAIFTRNITRDAIDHRFPIVQIPLASSVQILLATDIVQQQHYCHFVDSYGCRNPYSVDYGEDYRSRPDILTQTKTNQTYWNPNNEVMFKERVDPGYMRQLTFQDGARRTLLHYLRDNHPNFFPLGMVREEEQLQHISSNVEAIKQLIEPITHPNMLLPLLEKHYPDFFPPAVVTPADRLQYIQNHQKEAHDLAMPQLLPNPLQGYRIEEHWGLDIKEGLKSELEALGVNRIHFQELDQFIQEREVLTAEMFSHCHHAV